MVLLWQHFQEEVLACRYANFKEMNFFCYSVRVSSRENFHNVLGE